MYTYGIQPMPVGMSLLIINSQQKYMYMYYLLYLHVYIWYTAYASGYVTTNDKLTTEIHVHVLFTVLTCIHMVYSLCQWVCHY